MSGWVLLCGQMPTPALHMRLTQVLTGMPIRAGLCLCVPLGPWPNFRTRVAPAFFSHPRLDYTCGLTQLDKQSGEGGGSQKQKTGDRGQMCICWNAEA